jgi:hypothetical protein
MIKNEQTSWVWYTVHLEDDQSWGGWQEYSHHDTLDEALLELGELKRKDKVCRVVRVTTDVVA